MAKLLFLQNIQYEFLGPMYLSAAAKAAGHEVRLAMGQKPADFDSAVESFRPDLVAFSVMTGSHRWALGIARDLKARFGIRNIFGGAHPTFFPEFIGEDGVDMLVRGEGEEAIRDILGRLDAGQPLDDVANLTLQRDDGSIVSNPVRSLPRNLDELEYPDRNLYDALEGKLDRSVRTVITSRGCPFHCSFCFEDAQRDLYAGKGKYVRIRSVDGVLAELHDLKRNTQVRTVYFADDVFGMSRKWLHEFMPRYKREIGLPFICLVRADIVSADKDYARCLAEGGCKSVFFGIESGNETLRNRVLGKQLTNTQIRQAAALLHDAGIKFRAYNIVGLPDETLADALETLQLNIDIRTDYPWCSIFMPLPGTALSNYARERGFLDPSLSLDSLSQSFFTTSTLRLPDIDRMANLQKFFQTVVLWPWTRPLVHRLIRLRPNPLFTAWFGLVYFLVYIKSENKRFWPTLTFALRNYMYVLAKE